MFQLVKTIASAQVFTKLRVVRARRSIAARYINALKNVKETFASPFLSGTNVKSVSEGFQRQ